MIDKISITNNWQLFASNQQNIEVIFNKLSNESYTTQSQKRKSLKVQMRDYEEAKEITARTI